MLKPRPWEGRSRNIESFNTSGSLSREVREEIQVRKMGREKGKRETNNPSVQLSVQEECCLEYSRGFSSILATYSKIPCHSLPQVVADTNISAIATQLEIMSAGSQLGSPTADRHPEDTE